MVMVPGVVLCGSGSDGVDIGAGSSFDTGDNMLVYMDVDGKASPPAETGIDHKHWRVLFRNPKPEAPPRQETIKLSLRLLAQVVGKERAPTSLYTVDNRGFGCQVSEEEARKFWNVDGVRSSFVDCYRSPPNGEHHQGEYGLPKNKFPGPDDDLSEYRKYLDDWEAEHGGCVFFPHNQQSVKVRKEVDDPQESEYRMETLRTQLSMWDAQQEAYKDGFTLVTPKKFNYIKKQLMAKLGRQVTEKEVKIALEMHTLRKCAEQAVEQEARDLEARKLALEKWKLALEKWEQDLEVRKQAREKQLQEKQAQEKQLQEKQAQGKQLQEKQAKEALEKQANRKQAKKRAKRKQALEKQPKQKEALEKQAKQKEVIDKRARRLQAMHAEERAKQKQAIKKEVLEMRAEWKEALEMKKQALEQEARAPEKQAKESLEKYKQMQAKLALMEEAKMKPAPIEDLNDCDIFGSN